jgi:hypothetical protein
MPTHPLPSGLARRALVVAPLLLLFAQLASPRSAWAQG